MHSRSQSSESESSQDQLLKDSNILKQDQMLNTSTCLKHPLKKVTFPPSIITLGQILRREWQKHAVLRQVCPQHGPARTQDRRNTLRRRYRLRSLKRTRDPEAAENPRLLDPPNHWQIIIWVQSERPWGPNWRKQEKLRNRKRKLRPLLQQLDSDRQSAQAHLPVQTVHSIRRIPRVQFRAERLTRVDRTVAGPNRDGYKPEPQQHRQEYGNEALSRHPKQIRKKAQRHNPTHPRVPAERKRQNSQVNRWAQTLTAVQSDLLPAVFRLIEQWTKYKFQFL